MFDINFDKLFITDKVFIPYTSYFQVSAWRPLIQPSGSRVVMTEFFEGMVITDIQIVALTNNLPFPLFATSP